MMKRWKYRMATILNCRAIYLKVMGKIFTKPLTIEYQWIAPIKKIEKVKERNIVSAWKGNILVLYKR